MGERPTLILTTRLGVRPLGVRGDPLHAVAGQLLSVIRRRLGDGPANLLAEPQMRESDDGIDWYAARPGAVHPLAELSEGERTDALATVETHLAAIRAWVVASDWAAFLADDPATTSCTSICLKITAPWFLALDPAAQADAAKKVASLLEKEGVAYDIGAYRDAPPGLRIWGGATVETSNINALLPWLDWAYETVKGA